jgi:hypothetical protein
MSKDVQERQIMPLGVQKYSKMFKNVQNYLKKRLKKF